MGQIHNFLLVDDDPVFLAVAESVLLSLGQTVVATASDGDQGIAALDRADPPIDIIILDLNMPRLDGLAFMRAAAHSGFGARSSYPAARRRRSCARRSAWANC